MGYRVEVTASAKQDLQEAFDYIVEKEKSRIPAQQWYICVVQELKALREFPMSKPLIPEADFVGQPLRQSFVFSHRIVFLVDESSGVVYILRVYHSRRRPLNAKDVVR